MAPYPRVKVSFKLNHNKYSYHELPPLDAAISNMQKVIAQRERQMARDLKMLRTMQEGREDLAQQIEARRAFYLARGSST